MHHPNDEFENPSLGWATWHTAGHDDFVVQIHHRTQTTRYRSRLDHGPWIDGMPPFKGEQRSSPMQAEADAARDQKRWDDDTDVEALKRDALAKPIPERFLPLPANEARPLERASAPRAVSDTDDHSGDATEKAAAPDAPVLDRYGRPALAEPRAKRAPFAVVKPETE